MHNSKDMNLIGNRTIYNRKGKFLKKFSTGIPLDFRPSIWKKRNLVHRIFDFLNESFGSG